MGLRFIQPAFQLGQDRQTYFLTTDKSLLIAEVLEVTLDAIQFIDHRQRDIGTAGLALRLHFLRIDKLTTCVQPIAPLQTATPPRYNRGSLRSRDSRQAVATVPPALGWWCNQKESLAALAGNWLVPASGISWSGLDPAL